MKITSGSIAFLLALLMGARGARAQEQGAPAATEAQASEVKPDQVVSGAAPSMGDTPEPATASGGSAVRIVRLSQVKGTVQLDRNTGLGFEPAFSNLPVAEGQRLRLGEGVAEVEFEDNSTLRATPETTLEFPELQRSAAGATISRVTLLKGTLYVSLERSKLDQRFTVLVGDRTIAVPPGGHLRVEMGAPQSKVTVFDGSVEVAGSAGMTVVGKKKVLAFDTMGAAPATVAGRVETAPFDEWDKTAVSYHKLRAIPAAYAGSGYAYGISDLNYYGGFSNVGGCGSMWRPYLASAAWDPFANGVWAWYPGAGYSWVSPYPWGWTPFHFGSWEYCPTGGGWGWRPGGQWNGLINHPRPLNPTHHPGGNVGPPRPPHPPMPGHSTLVVVNTHPLSVSKLSSPGTFTFRNDSAGLGVPRGSFGRLNKVSNGVEQHGFVSRQVDQTSIVNPTSMQAQHTTEAARGSGQGTHTAGNGSVTHAPGGSESAGRGSGATARSGGGESRGASGRSGSGYSGQGSGGSSGGSRASAPASTAPSAPSGGGTATGGAARH